MAIKADTITYEIRGNTLPLERSLTSSVVAAERAERRLTQTARDGARSRARQAGDAARQMQAAYDGTAFGASPSGASGGLLSSPAVAEARRLFPVDALAAPGAGSGQGRVQVAQLPLLFQIGARAATSPVGGAILRGGERGLGFIANALSVLQLIPSPHDSDAAALSRDAIATRLGRTPEETEAVAQGMTARELVAEILRLQKASERERQIYDDTVNSLYGGMKDRVDESRSLLEKRRQLLGMNLASEDGMSDEDFANIRTRERVANYFSEHPFNKPSEIDFKQFQEVAGSEVFESSVFEATDLQRDLKGIQDLYAEQRAVLEQRLRNFGQPSAIGVPGSPDADPTNLSAPAQPSDLGIPNPPASGPLNLPSPPSSAAPAPSGRTWPSGVQAPDASLSLPDPSDQERYIAFLQKVGPLLKGLRPQLEAINILQALQGQQLKTNTAAAQDDVKAKEKATAQQKEIADALIGFGDILTTGIKSAKDFNDATDAIGLGFLNLALQEAFGQGKFGGVFNQILGNASGDAGILSLFGSSLAKSTISPTAGGGGGFDLGAFLGSGLSWLFGLFGGGRASGGQVLPGRLYEVGEAGREWFAPSIPGQVIPNSVIKAAAGGGGASSQPITFNISMAGANGDRAIAEIAAAAVKKGLASVPEINRQHRIRFA